MRTLKGHWLRGLGRAWPVVRAVLITLKPWVAVRHHEGLALVLQVLVVAGNAVARTWPGKRRR